MTGVGVTVRSSTDDVVGELGGSKGVRSSVIFVGLGVRGWRKGWVKELCASQAFSASSVPIFVEGRGMTLGPITLPDYHQVDTDALSAGVSMSGNCQFADIEVCASSWTAVVQRTRCPNSDLLSLTSSDRTMRKSRRWILKVR